MRAIMVPVAALLLMLWPGGTRAGCVEDNHSPRGAFGNLTETFEARGGTDNQFLAVVYPGNMLDPNFRFGSHSPPLWGEESGLVVVGATHGAAFWIKQDKIESQTGYHFSASFLIAVDGISEGKRISFFMSKPIGGDKGTWAAWRLTFIKALGQLQLELIVGLNTATNNPSAARYVYPITTNTIYDVAITYDTRRRFYFWSVNGQVLAAADMPCDYPLIGTRIIGSSGSSAGRNTVFIVDNVRWYELPE